MNQGIPFPPGSRGKKSCKPCTDFGNSNGPNIAKSGGVEQGISSVVLCPERKVNESPCGAEARIDGRRQNPAGKSLPCPRSRGSAKEHGPKGKAFVNTQKVALLAGGIVGSPWAQEAPPPILASAAVRASAPGTRFLLCQLAPGPQARFMAKRKLQKPASFLAMGLAGIGFGFPRAEAVDVFPVVI